MRHPIFSPVPCPRSLVGSDYVSTLKAVPCWVLNFCDKILNLSRNFFLLWGQDEDLLCSARDCLYSFKGGPPDSALRKVSLQNFLFLHHSRDCEFISLLGVWILILVPCTAHLNRSIFGLLAYFKRSLSGSVSLYISSVQGSLKVPFPGLSSLFVRSVTFFSFS